jgi:hypothetical protein
MSNNTPYYLLDLPTATKIQGTALSGAAGVFAGSVVGVPVTHIVSFFVSMPAFAGVVSGVYAFASITALASDYWNDRLATPQNLIVRRTRQPAIAL